MMVRLRLDNLSFREDFEKAIELYPCTIEGDILTMTANVVQCMELVSIVSLYQLSVEKPDWERGDSDETTENPLPF